jgi:hypothetical protein
VLTKIGFYRLRSVSISFERDIINAGMDLMFEIDGDDQRDSTYFI